MRKILSTLLFPFTIWYAVGIAIRNLLFKAGILKRTKHKIPTIGVGNLSTGGTGKTPHVEYLIRLLSPRFNVAVLSRGYGRETKGFLLANDNSSAQMIGDEPFQYFNKFKNITIAVCEDRNKGVEMLSSLHPTPDIIILDDVFQHKSIIPKVNILLTEYYNPFYRDLILPFGNLREFRNGSKNADIVIITKCPDAITETEKEEFRKKIDSANSQKIFFSSVKYGAPVPLSGKEFSGYETLLVFSGIANPAPLYDYLEKDYHIFKHTFPDHHTFTQKEMLHLKKAFKAIPSQSKAIITTEKDAARLKNTPEIDLLKDFPLFYLPIEVCFLDFGNLFNQTILNLSHLDKSNKL